MSELIYRQAAIDAIEKMNIPEDMCVFEILSHIEVEIATLPTIQPEPPIIKCKDCKWWRKQKDSTQGRCELLEMYPAGGWYCANAERRTDGQSKSD